MGMICAAQRAFLMLTADWLNWLSWAILAVSTSGGRLYFRAAAAMALTQNSFSLGPIFGRSAPMMAYCTWWAVIGCGASGVARPTPTPPITIANSATFNQTCQFMRRFLSWAEGT